MTISIFGTQSPSAMALLNAVIANSPSHLRPVFTAVRDEQVALQLINHSREAFAPGPESGQPTISMILDDTDCSRGPAGFHLPSVEQMIREAFAFAVVSGAPIDVPYAAMSAAAVAGKTVVIIETRLAHEAEWIQLIQKLAPKRPLMICTVKGGEA